MQNLITETYSYGVIFDKPKIDLNPGITTLFNLVNVFGSHQALESNYSVGYSFYIESLIAQCKISSIATTAIPNIVPEATSAEKFLELEKTNTLYPFFNLQIYIDYDGRGWNLEAVIPVQNRKNQYYPIPLLKPYLTMGDIKPLPKLAKLGISINDAGHGNLGLGDVIRIQCDARKEVTLVPKAAENIYGTESYEKTFPVNALGTRVAPYRPSRKSIYIRNSGTTKVFFHFGYQSALELLEPGKKLYLMPGEAWSFENSYFVLPHDLWAEAVSEDSADVGKLTVMELY